MSGTFVSNPAGVTLQSINGTVAVNGRSLSVNSASTFAGTLTASSGLAVLGGTTLGGQATLASFAAQSGTVTGVLACGGSVAQTLSVSGPSTLAGTVTCAGQLSAQTLAVSGQTVLGATTAATLASTSLISATLSVSGIATLSGPVTCPSTLNVGGQATLASLAVSGLLSCAGQARLASSSQQPLQVVNTGPASAGYVEVLLDRTSVSAQAYGSVRYTPGTGLGLVTGGVQGLTMAAATQQVTVTAVRSGQTFVVRGDGVVSSSTEVLLDNSARTQGQTAIVGVDAGGMYLTSGTAARALNLDLAGNATLSGRLLVGGTLQASGTATLGTVNATSVSTSGLTAQSVATSSVLGVGSSPLSLQGSDPSATVNVTNILAVNSVQAKPGSALSLTGQDAGITTSITGQLKVDTVRKRAATAISVMDPVTATASVTTPLLNLSGNPGQNMLNVVNTDSSANSDAALSLDRSAFGQGYTALVGLRPNVGFLVQLGGTPLLTADVPTRTATFAGPGSFAGALTVTGALTTAAACSVAGALTVGGASSFGGSVTVSGLPATLRLANGSSLYGTLSTDQSFMYLRFMDASGALQDRMKCDTSGTWTVNGGVVCTGGLSGASLSTGSLTVSSAGNTPSVLLAGLAAGSSMASVAADTSAMRLRFYDTNATMQDALTIDRSGNCVLQRAGASLTVPGALTAAGLSVTASAPATLSGALTVAGATSMNGPVTVGGQAPWSVGLGPTGNYALLSSTATSFALQVTNGSTLTTRLTVSQAGTVAVPGALTAGSLSTPAPFSSGSSTVTDTAPGMTMVSSATGATWARVYADAQLLHLAQWDGTGAAPADRMTLNQTGLASIPGGVTTSQVTIANSAGAAVNLGSGPSSSTAAPYGALLADQQSLRLRAPDRSQTLQDRLVIDPTGTVTVPVALTAASVLTTQPITLSGGSAVGAGPAVNLLTGGLLAAQVYAERGMMSLRVQNTSGTLVERARFDTLGAVTLAGPTSAAGPVTCQDRLSVQGSAPVLSLTDSPSNSTSVFGQLAATASQMVLSNVNGQGQLQNAISIDPSANLTCPGSLTVGAVSTTRLTATGPVQASSASSQPAQLLLVDPVNGGYGASIAHSGAGSTPTLQLALTDNGGTARPQLTLTPGQLAAGSLTLTGAVTAAGSASVGGTLTVTGALVGQSTSTAVGTATVLADPSSQAANLAFANQTGSAVSTQVISTPNYASFLQLVPGSGITERMRFDSTGNVLLGGSLLPNSTSLTLGSQNAKWSQIWSTNPLNTTSDARLKDDICPTELGLAFVRALHPVSYRWKDRADPLGPRSHGFLAQQVAQAAPADFAHVSVSEDTASMQYEGLIAPLVRAVQQLAVRVDRLYARM